MGPSMQNLLFLLILYDFFFKEKYILCFQYLSLYKDVLKVSDLKKGNTIHFMIVLIIS